MIAASKRGIAAPRPRGCCTSGSSHSRAIAWPAVCPASTSTSPRVRVPSPILGADARLLDADRPDPAGAAEQRAQAVDGGQEVAAVLLHHRQQQVAAGVAAEPRVLEHRQPRQQHAPRLALVARQRQRALQHVARRQHAELVAQLPRAPAAVEHRHDGVQRQPGIASSARRAGSADPCRRRSTRCSVPQLHDRHSMARSMRCDSDRDGVGGIRSRTRDRDAAS